MNVGREDKKSKHLLDSLMSVCCTPFCVFTELQEWLKVYVPSHGSAPVLGLLFFSISDEGSWHIQPHGFSVAESLNLLIGSKAINWSSGNKTWRIGGSSPGKSVFNLIFCRQLLFFFFLSIVCVLTLTCWPGETYLLAWFYTNLWRN